MEGQLCGFAATDHDRLLRIRRHIEGTLVDDLHNTVAYLDMSFSFRECQQWYWLAVRKLQHATYVQQLHLK
jgi:hypothetical protein